MADDFAQFETALRRCSGRHRALVFGYLKTGTPAGAARAAEYKSTDTARPALRRSEVQDAIAIGQRLRWKRLHVDATRVLAELVDMLEADPADMFTDAGQLKPLADWPIGLRKRLQGIDTSETAQTRNKGATWVTKVKLVDPLKMLELIGRHVDVAAFKDTLTADDADLLTRRLLAANQRLRDATPPADTLPSPPDAVVAEQ